MAPHDRARAERPRVIVTEAGLREQLRTPTHGARVVVPAGAQLSPAAEDFVRAWRLEVAAEAASAAAERPGESASDAPTSVGHGSERGSGAQARWDRPGAFPVVLDGPIPRCEVCESEVRRKPSHLTQLDAEYFAPKTHPRIALRGKLDSLHALALLIAARAGAEGREALMGQLRTLAAYCREIQSAEYAGRLVDPLVLDGRDEASVHAVTHDPDGHLGIPHVVPDEEDPEVLHWLSWLRCQVRETEIVAMGVTPIERASVEQRSLVHALNRLSSGVYLLILLVRAADPNRGRSSPA